MKKMCEFWDCGWCYAIERVPNNSQGGQCTKPKECPQYKLIPIKVLH